LLWAGTVKTYPIVANAASSSPYLEDLTLSFKQDLGSVAYNVTMVDQCGTNGSGPLYSIAGRSNPEYWYIIWVGWNWPSSLNPYSPSRGFEVGYNVYSGDTTLFGASASLNHVSNGDLVMLKLSFSNNMVVMYFHDWNSSLTDQRSYSAFGATSFLGNPDSPTDSKGFFSGLMTRQYYSAPFYGDEESTVYKSSNPISSAWMRIAEFPYPDKTPSLFDQYGSYDYGVPNLFQNLSSNGASESSNGYQFVTGGLSAAPVCAVSPAILSPRSLLGSYWYVIPVVVIGVVVLGLVLLARRSTRWVAGPMIQPGTLSPGRFVAVRDQKSHQEDSNVPG